MNAAGESLGEHFGGGTIFKLDAAGTLMTLHSFTGGGSEGAGPLAAVIQASDGNFYGTTAYGGAFGVGTAFKFDGAGTLTTLHSFAGGSDGRLAFSFGALIQAADGSFYGTASEGGPGGGGTVFRLTVAPPVVDVPDPPLHLKASPGDSRVTLEWLASSGAESYRVKRSTVKAGPFSPIAEVTETAFADTTVTNGIKYFYVVTAVNAAGESLASNKASAIPAPVPAVPTGVSAVTGANAGEVTLSWSASPGATAYKVKRSTTHGGPYSSAKKVTTLSYTQGGLTSGRTYFFIVIAINGTGESGPSAEVSAVAR